MRRIILPTDFSKNSLVGMKYAMTLYGFEDVKYFLINAVEPPRGRASVFMSLIERLDKQSQMQLIEMNKLLKEWHGKEDVDIDLITVHGDIMSNMEDLVEELDATSIFMGTKGRSDVAGKFIGSNTFKVLKHTHTPIYIVPAKTEIETPTKIGFASDLSEISEELIGDIVSFTKRQNAKLHIVNVVEPETAIDKLKYDEYDKHFGEIEHEIHVVKGNNITEDLNDFAVNSGIDLMIMVRHSHTFFERLFHTSSTREMAMVSAVPLLMLKD